MRGTQWRVMTVGLAAVILRAADTSAQAQIQQTTDSMMVGVALGRVGNVDEAGSEGSRDVSVLFERHVVTSWHVRAEVARGTFVFPASKGAPRDGVSLTRFTFGAVNTTPEWMSGPTVGYAGGGLGAYRFGSGPTSGADFTRFGVYAVAGIRAPRDTPFSVAIQGQADIVRGPRKERGIFSIIATGSIGACFRF